MCIRDRSKDSGFDVYGRLAAAPPDVYDRQKNDVYGRHKKDLSGRQTEGPKDVYGRQKNVYGRQPN